MDSIGFCSLGRYILECVLLVGCSPCHDCLLDNALHLEERSSEQEKRPADAELFATGIAVLRQGVRSHGKVAH